eukprot:TRINITY_DN500_c0_g2_i14.p1 TRINITY_DN500_c0_g2~~TRINITY_DN500_c0_g2_i14.p1  ORF type:complete len:195 (-),score=12.92 TRINITY_DN500_c0_g2_i14:280-864(-)
MEQLNLLSRKENARRYSPTLLAVACLWENTSPSLYRMILRDGFLTLPSSSHLRRLSEQCVLGGERFVSVKEPKPKYLKARARKLDEREKIVALLVDEVATAKRVEYSNGAFFGYEEMEPTKTVLAFLITSICGKYKDIVGLYPVVIIPSIWSKRRITLENSPAGRKRNVDICRKDHKIFSKTFPPTSYIHHSNF